MCRRRRHTRLIPPGRHGVPGLPLVCRARRIAGCGFIPQDSPGATGPLLELRSIRIPKQGGAASRGEFPARAAVCVRHIRARAATHSPGPGSSSSRDSAPIGNTAFFLSPDDRANNGQTGLSRWPKRTDSRPSPPWGRIPFRPPASRLRRGADECTAVMDRGTTGGAWRPRGECWCAGRANHRRSRAGVRPPDRRSGSPTRP